MLWQRPWRDLFCILRRALFDLVRPRKGGLEVLLPGSSSRLGPVAGLEPSSGLGAALTGMRLGLGDAASSAAGRGRALSPEGAPVLPSCRGRSVSPGDVTAGVARLAPKLLLE